MSMFSSRPPVNDDKEPMVMCFSDPKEDGTRLAVWEAELLVGDVNAHWVFEYAPRPEFDRPQHNPTNPILEAFRLRGVTAEEWLRGSVLSRVSYNVGATQAHIAHARRVLTRLANLTKEDSA